MISKIKKYLLRHKEINVYRKNESGSEYFKVGNSIIRVSDHVASSRNDPDVLNIVVCGDNFIVMFGNKIINVNDYNAFKSFLKYHIQMCDCFKDIINKGLNRKSIDYASKDSTSKGASESSIVYKGEEFKVPASKAKGVKSMIKNNCFPNRTSLIKHLRNQLHLNVE